MSRLRLIWEDIKTGRNIELYFTTAFALVVAIAGLSGFDNQRLLTSATLAALALVSYSLLQNRLRTQLPIIIRADNQSNVEYLCAYIEANKIEKARLIQYSGDKMRRVVENLLSKGARVELLLQHPSAVPNFPELRSFQREKIALFNKTAKRDFRNHQNLIIRYYKEAASVRGVKLDDGFLSMGWYTYRSTSPSDKTPWLYGHNNTTISVYLNRAETRDLAATFDDVFLALWENAVPHEEVEAV